MGMYVVKCPCCGQPHYWFSGNLDQRCPKCRTTVTVNDDGTTTSTVTPLDPSFLETEVKPDGN